MGVLAALRDYVPDQSEVNQSKQESSALRLITGSIRHERVSHWDNREMDVEATRVEEVKLWRPGPIEENFPME